MIRPVLRYVSREEFVCYLVEQRILEVNDSDIGVVMREVTPVSRGCINIRIQSKIEKDTF